MTSVVVSVSVEGFHRWSGAPQEVSFLRAPHRHNFYFLVEIDVSHLGPDRGVEFFLLQQEVRSMIKDGPGYSEDFPEAVDFGEMSCEMIAHKLNELLKILSYRVVRVEIWEDRENGAIVKNVDN